MELNKVFLVGNLARDPEVRYLPSGDPVCDFDIGVNRSYKDRQGERQKETAWVRISSFSKQAEFCSNYLRKGTAVFVEGRLRTSSWETPAGEKRSRLDVVADRISFAYPRSTQEAGHEAEPPAGAPPSQPAPPQGASGRPSAPGPAPEAEGGATEDDLPF